MGALRYLPFLERGLRRSGPPLHLTVFVTGRCNLRCRHCFHWRAVAASTPGPELADLVRLADSAARMGPLLWVSLGGGEPFLRSDLPAVAAAFGRHGLRHLAIPTNGLVESRQHAAVEEILGRTARTHLAVSVSIDGPPEVHDAIRALPGAHARAVSAAREYVRQARATQRLGVGLIFTVTRENQHVLAAHVDELARELRPDNLTINLARGTALDESLLEVDLDRYREVVETKHRLMREGVVRYFDFPLARLAVARDRLMYEHIEGVARGAPRRHLPCTAGTLSAVVYEDGSVHPCEILGKPIGRLPDVDWDLGRLWESATARDLRAEIRDTHCKCTYECAQADNVLFQPALWPRLGLGALRS